MPHLLMPINTVILLATRTQNVREDVGTYDHACRTLHSPLKLPNILGQSTGAAKPVPTLTIPYTVFISSILTYVSTMYTQVSLKRYKNDCAAKETTGSRWAMSSQVPCGVDAV